jgi:hypothetical protein
MIHEQRKYMKIVAYKDYKIKMDKTYNKPEYVFTNRVYFKRTWLGKNVTSATYSRITTNQMDLDISDYLNINILPKDAVEVDSKYTDIPPI